MSKKKKDEEPAADAPPPNAVGDDQAVAKAAPEPAPAPPPAAPEPAPAPPPAAPEPAPAPPPAAPEPVEGPVPDGHCRVHLLGREREFLAAIVIAEPAPRLVHHDGKHYEQVGIHRETGCRQYVLA